MLRMHLMPTTLDKLKYHSKSIVKSKQSAKTRQRIEPRDRTKWRPTNQKCYCKRFKRTFPEAKYKKSWQSQARLGKKNRSSYPLTGTLKASKTSWSINNKIKELKQIRNDSKRKNMFPNKNKQRNRWQIW